MIRSNSTNARFGRRHTSSVLAGTTAMAAVLACGIAAEPVRAADACGAVAPDGTVECPSAGNPYRRGISYATPVDAEGAAIDLNVSLDADVVVKPRDSRRIRAGVDLSGSLDGSVTLDAAEGSKVRTDGRRQAGVRVVTESGDIAILAPAIVTHGNRSAGIVARSRAGGDIEIVADSVRTFGEHSRGIVARSRLGEIVIGAGDVRTFGGHADAIDARGGHVMVSIDGTVATEGDFSYGASLLATDGEAQLTLDGRIRTSGLGAWGADIEGAAGAMLSGGGTIRVEGSLAVGASVRSADGDAVIDLARVIATGPGSVAAVASSEYGDARITLGEARTSSDGLPAVSAVSTYGDASVTITGDARADGDHVVAVEVDAGGHAEAIVEDVATSGFGGRAIVAQGRSVQVTVNGTAASRGGADVEGHGATVLARGLVDDDGAGGDVVVTNAGRIVARGGNNAALLAEADNDLRIEGAGAFATHGANSAGIGAFAGGNLAIDIGDVRTTGDDSIGIDADTYANAHVVVGSVETRGAGSTGIRVSADGEIDLEAGRISTAGDNAIGAQLVALGDEGTIRASVGAISTLGARSHGISVVGEHALDVELTAADIVTTGERSSGIHIVRNNGGGGNFDIAVGSAATSGGVSDGVTLITDNVGQATIRADRLEVGGPDSAGIYAQASAMDVDVTVGSALATGERSAGIYANGANVVLHSTGTIEATGPGGRGIAVVTGGNADLAIDGDVTVTGDRSTAVAVLNTAAGGVTNVQATGDIVSSGYFTTGFSAGGEGSIVARLNNLSTTGDSLSAFAIIARSTAGDIDVAVHDVTMRGYSIDSSYIRSDAGNASMTVTGTYSTNMSGGIGLEALGLAAVSVNHMDITGYNVRAVTAIGGEARVAIAGTVDDRVQGTGYDAGAAIYVFGGGGDFSGLGLVENDGTVNTFAEGRTALEIEGVGSAALLGTGTVHTRGERATAVIMKARTGEILLDQAAIVTEGDLARGADITGSEGDVVIALDRVSTQGGFSDGVAIASLGEVAVDIGAIETSGAWSTGLRVSTSGGIAASLGEVATAGNRASAVQLSAEGDIDVAADGLISTAGNQAAGLFLLASGDISVAAEEIATEGALSHGVRAHGEGDALLRHFSIATAGAGADGINLIVTGAADLALGTVSTQGDMADGIDVRAGGAVRAVIGSATVGGADSRAVAIASDETIALELGLVRAEDPSALGVRAEAARSVSIAVAQGGGIVAAGDAILLSSGDGATLTNRGIVSAGGALVRATSGPVAIWNGGEMTGGLGLGDAADLVTNAGTMRLTGSAFGGGDDRLVNHGRLFLAGELDFGAGNDTFVNEGILSLAAAPGTGIGLRALAAGPITRAIAGLATFANDGLVDLRSGVAGDVLDLSGSFAGTGGSQVALDVRFGGTPTADRLVIAGAATGSTGIVLAPLDAPTAFQSGIVLVDAGAGTRADAFRLEGPTGFGLFASGLVFDAAASSFRLVTTPSGSAYRLLKVAEGARSAWLDSSDTVAAQLASGRGAGFWLAAGGRLDRRDQVRRFEAFGFGQDIDMGYEQDFFSTQFGYGLDRGALTLGVTAGYGNSTLGFGGSADRIDYDALNAGFYAALRSGRLQVDALAKYDRYDIAIAFQPLGAKAETDGSAFGARLQAGLRFGSSRFSVEPRLGLSYQRVDIDPLALAARVRFEDWNGGRGTAGLRLASLRPLGKASLKLYAEADYVRTLGKGAELSLATGAVTLQAQDARLPDHGIGKFGVEVATDRVTGFLEAFGRFGGDYRGGGARAGLRLAF
jgi:hypothetical protein